MGQKDLVYDVGHLRYLSSRIVSKVFTVSTIRKLTPYFTKIILEIESRKTASFISYAKN